MRKPLQNLFIIHFIALTAQVSAQTVSTPIVGFQKISVPVGLSTAGFPLLNEDILKTSATSLAGNSLSLSGETNVGSKLSSVEPYYIEVYSGNLKGDRFDVNTAATVSAANGAVVLDSASGNNTYAVSSILNQLDGATVALRKHITIEQVQAMSSASLAGSNTQTAADQIQLYNSTTQAYDSYFLRGDGITWRKVGTTTSANKVPIPPGIGVFLSKKSAAVDLTATGTVRQNDFASPFKVGLQLLAPAYPSDLSPSGLGGTTSNGWTGNNTQTAADQIQTFNPVTQAYDAYFLRGDGTTWRKVGTTTTVTTSNVISSSGAFFASRKTADDSNILLNPIAP